MRFFEPCRSRNAGLCDCNDLLPSMKKTSRTTCTWKARRGTTTFPYCLSLALSWMRAFPSTTFLGRLVGRGKLAFLARARFIPKHAVYDHDIAELVFERIRPGGKLTVVQRRRQGSSIGCCRTWHGAVDMMLLKCNPLECGGGNTSKMRHPVTSVD